MSVIGIGDAPERTGFDSDDQPTEKDDVNKKKKKELQPSTK